MKTPVALIIFNRPDTTARVFAEIARAKPPALFVIADGPRPHRPEDRERCAEARAVTERIDWSCEVQRDYSDVNLGCGRRPARGITWVFEQVTEAIILEDDCLPDPSFFPFCDELLERYRHDTRVMHIAGSNFQLGRKRTDDSYYFSQFNISWGWATWRRAWRHFDQALKAWPALRGTSWLEDLVPHPRAIGYWRHCFDGAYDRHGNVPYWDHQWTFACWAQNGLSVHPARNLISNIGFGPEATHTRSTQDPLARRTASLPTEAMEFPLAHPPHMTRLADADRFILHDIVVPSVPRPPSPYRKVRRQCRAFLTEHPSLGSPRTLCRRVYEIAASRLRLS